MTKIIYILLLLLFPTSLVGQMDSTRKKISFGGDFRFRVEQDWNSLKSDGSYRDDRTRLRYRVRFGFVYEYKDWVSFGIRLRTGDPKKQQDSQLTLGDGLKEFSSLPIAFEKAYAKFNHKWFSAWIGKNTFPFEKQNELFWSDNVFPDGVSLSGSFHFNNKYLQTLQVNTGYFVLATNGTSIESDSYFQGIQLVSTHWKNRLKLFPSFYYFNKIPNIPDGNSTFEMNYAIMQFGGKLELFKEPSLTLEFDYYNNIKNYGSNEFVPNKFKNQKQGFVVSLNTGSLKKAGDWKSQLTYTYLERFAAVDFLTQNDWARWDYATYGSNDGRLTNFKGTELMGGYALDENITLIIRYFIVDQIIPFGIEKETGNRFRFDFNIGF